MRLAIWLWPVLLVFVPSALPCGRCAPMAGYPVSAVDGSLPVCADALLGAIQEGCTLGVSDQHYDTHLPQQKALLRSGVRQRVLSALWRCHAVIIGNGSAAPASLRVLVWDQHAAWLTPALQEFSSLFGVPVDIDLQPYERLLLSVLTEGGIPLNGSATWAFVQGSGSGARFWLGNGTRNGSASPKADDANGSPAQSAAGNSSQHAVLFFASTFTQQLAEFGLLENLSDLVDLAGPQLDWLGISPPYRLRLSDYKGQTVAVPLDGSLLYLFVRSGAWHDAVGPREVPRTWSELLQFVVDYDTLRGNSSSAQALPQSAVCIARGPGCSQVAYLQAVWSSIAQTHGASQATHFDGDTLEPLVDAPAAHAAFRIMAQLLSAAAPPESDDVCDHGSLAFARGRCVLGLASFIPQMRLLQRPEALDAALHMGSVRVAPLPGSDLVWPYVSGEDRSEELVPCSPEACPYATPVALAGPAIPDAAVGEAAAALKGSSGGVSIEPGSSPEVLMNRAPQAVTSLLVGGINSRSPLLVRLLSLELLSFLASAGGVPGGSAAGQALQCAFPVRDSWWQPGSAEAWAQAGYGVDALQAVFPVLQESQAHDNLAWGLHMVGQAAYNNMLASTLAAIQAGNISVDPWVSPRQPRSDIAGRSALPLADALMAAKATLSARYPPEVYLRLYKASLEPWVQGNHTPRVDCLLNGGSQGSAPKSPLLPTVLGTVLPVLFMCAIAAACWRARRACAGAGRGASFGTLRKMHVPAIGAPVALCVTDIQDSTSLWESLPPDVVARAVDIHHRCVRRLALRHGGYESATEGDSFILVFDTVRAAVAFALDLQAQLLAATDWPTQLLATEVCRPTHTHLPAGYPFSHTVDTGQHHLPERALSPRLPRIARARLGSESDLRSVRSVGRGSPSGGLQDLPAKYMGRDGAAGRDASPPRGRAGHKGQPRGLHTILFGTTSSPQNPAARQPSGCHSLIGAVLASSVQTLGSVASLAETAAAAPPAAPAARPLPLAAEEDVPAVDAAAATGLPSTAWSDAVSGALQEVASSTLFRELPQITPLHALHDQLSWPPGLHSNGGGGLGASSLGMGFRSLTPPAAAACGPPVVAQHGGEEARQAPGVSGRLSAMIDSTALLGASIYPVFNNPQSRTGAEMSDGGGGIMSPAVTSRLWEETDCDAVSSALQAAVFPEHREALGDSAAPVSGASGPLLDGLGRACSQGTGCRSLVEAMQAAAADPEGAAGRQLLLFRGLRVRVGIHAAVPSSGELRYNAAAARMVYGGPCVVACKAVADMAHGGQVFLSASAHRALAAECHGLGGRPPGTMVLQMGILEIPPPPARAAAAPPLDGSQHAGVRGVSERTFTGSKAPPLLHHSSSDLVPANSQLSSRLRSSTLGRNHSRFSPRAHTGKPAAQSHPRARDPSEPQQPHDRHALPSLEDMGLEAVYCVTAPALSQRLALVPPPRFPADRGRAQDVYRAPLGRVAYAVVRVPAAVSLLSWRAAVVAESLRLVARTAVEELRRAPGAYLVSLSAAEVRAAFPCPVAAVLWALQLRAALLRVDWPQELLQHELGEVVEAVEAEQGPTDGGSSQGPSEAETPRPRWPSLGGKARSASRDGGGGGGPKRGFGSYGSTGDRSMSGPGAGPRSGSLRRSSVGVAAWEALLQLRNASQQQSRRAGPSLASESCLSGDSDNTGTGVLEPVARTAASVPLRRHRHSIESYTPAARVATSSAAEDTLPAAAAAAAPALVGEVLSGRLSEGHEPAQLDSLALAELAVHMQLGAAAPPPSPAQSGPAAAPSFPGGNGPSTSECRKDYAAVGRAYRHAVSVKARSVTADGIEPKRRAMTRLRLASSLECEIVPDGQGSVGSPTRASSPGAAAGAQGEYIPRRHGAGPGLIPPASTTLARGGHGGSDVDVQTLAARCSAFSMSSAVLGSRSFAGARAAPQQQAERALAGIDASDVDVREMEGTCSLAEEASPVSGECTDGAAADAPESCSLPVAPAPTPSMPCLPSPLVPCSSRLPRKGRVILRGLRLHVGVATGSLDWAVGGKSHALTYTGRAVSRAIRLAASAASGQVLCDAATQRAIAATQRKLVTAAPAAAARQPTSAAADDLRGLAPSQGGYGDAVSGEESAGATAVLALRLLPLSPAAGRRLSVRPAEGAFLCEMSEPGLHRDCSGDGRPGVAAAPAAQHLSTASPRLLSATPPPFGVALRAASMGPRGSSPPRAGQRYVGGWQASRSAASLPTISGGPGGSDAGAAWPLRQGRAPVSPMRRSAASFDITRRQQAFTSMERSEAAACKAVSSGLTMLSEGGAFAHAVQSVPLQASHAERCALAVSGSGLGGAGMGAGAGGMADAHGTLRSSNTCNTSAVGSDCFGGMMTMTCSVAATSASALLASSSLLCSQPVRASPIQRHRSCVFESPYMPYIVCERVDEEDEGHDASGDDGTGSKGGRARPPPFGPGAGSHWHCDTPGAGAGAPGSPAGAASGVTGGSFSSGVAAAEPDFGDEACARRVCAAAEEPGGASLSAPIPILQPHGRGSRGSWRSPYAGVGAGYAAAQFFRGQQPPPSPVSARAGAAYAAGEFLDHLTTGHAGAGGHYVDCGDVQGNFQLLAARRSCAPAGGDPGVRDAPAHPMNWPGSPLAARPGSLGGLEVRQLQQQQQPHLLLPLPVSPGRLLHAGSSGRRDRPGSGVGDGVGRHGSSSGGRLENPPTFAALAQLDVSERSRCASSDSDCRLGVLTLNGGS